jgi:TRAP-type mannitol/chloroaromatic compound transport system substrate-binding protein
MGECRKNLTRIEVAGLWMRAIGFPGKLCNKFGVTSQIAIGQGKERGQILKRYFFEAEGKR